MKLAPAEEGTRNSASKDNAANGGVSGGAGMQHFQDRVLGAGLAKQKLSHQETLCLCEDRAPD